MKSNVESPEQNWDREPETKSRRAYLSLPCQLQTPPMVGNSGCQTTKLIKVLPKRQITFHFQSQEAGVQQLQKRNSEELAQTASPKKLNKHALDKIINQSCLPESYDCSQSFCQYRKQQSWQAESLVSTSECKRKSSLHNRCKRIIAPSTLKLSRNQSLISGHESPQYSSVLKKQDLNAKNSEQKQSASGKSPHGAIIQSEQKLFQVFKEECGSIFFEACKYQIDLKAKLKKMNPKISETFLNDLTQVFEAASLCDLKPNCRNKHYENLSEVCYNHSEGAKKKFFENPATACLFIILLSDERSKVYAAQQELNVSLMQDTYNAVQDSDEVYQMFRKASGNFSRRILGAKKEIKKMTQTF